MEADILLQSWAMKPDRKMSLTHFLNSEESTSPHPLSSQHIVVSSFILVGLRLMKYFLPTFNRQTQLFTVKCHNHSHVSRFKSGHIQAIHNHAGGGGGHYMRYSLIELRPLFSE